MPSPEKPEIGKIQDGLLRGISSVLRHLSDMIDLSQDQQIAAGPDRRVECLTANSSNDDSPTVLMARNPPPTSVKRLIDASSPSDAKRFRSSVSQAMFPALPMIQTGTSTNQIDMLDDSTESSLASPIEKLPAAKNPHEGHEGLARCSPFVFEPLGPSWYKLPKPNEPIC